MIPGAISALLAAAALAAESPAAPGSGPGTVPQALPLVSAAALPAPAPAAAEAPLLRDGESTVAPEARFRVVAGAPLADARLALYDAQEALVPAEEQAEIGSAASRYLLAPSRPLRPGSRYTLRLEGAAGRDVHDLAERSYRPLSFSLRVAGEPPAEKPARKKGKRKRAPQ